MPFGLWAWMGPRNHVLGGSPETLRDFAMATTFWLSMGYNFGCVIASGTIFDSIGLVSGVKLSDEVISDYEVLRDVVMATVATIFGFLYGVHIGATQPLGEYD